MGDPRDQDDEKAERKREVGGPECQPGRSTDRLRLPMRKADLEDEQGNRDGKDAIAEGFDGGRCPMPMQPPVDQQIAANPGSPRAREQGVILSGRA